MGRGSSKAGGENTSQKATKSVNIENMNEAQLDKEIAKAERQIERAEKTMEANGQTAADKARQEAFPLGVGGDGWTAQRRRQETRNIERSVSRAAKYTEAYENKKAAETRLKSLRNAKDKVAGTGKTLSQIKNEEISKAVKETPKTLKWKTVQKGGFSNGGYSPKIIQAGSFEIRGSDGMYSIFENGKLLGRTDKLSKAKTYVEKKKKR